MTQSREIHNEYVKNIYKQRRNDALIYLGGKCAVCGTIEKLEFDHIDPSEKEFFIGDVIIWNKKDFWNEVNKCQLLCKEHHIEKTRKDKGIPNRKETHGNISCYKYCHCELCRKVKTDYMREYFKLHPEKRKH